KALAALRKLDPETIVVIGGSDTTGTHRGTTVPERAFGGFGPPTGHSETLPLSLGIAQRLLEQAGTRVPVRMWSAAWDADPDRSTSPAEELAERPEREGLPVIGDGSARRSLQAPGYPDERGFACDESVHRALAEGDTGALL